MTLTLSVPVESPIINTQSAAISLASLQPPLMTAPPLQPRPATTGALDLMLPLQPKLLPGYNLQSSFLSSTLSTVRPPDLPGKIEDFKSNVEVILESNDSEMPNEENSCDNLDKVTDGIDINNGIESVNEIYVEVDNVCSNDEVNSNVIESKTETSIVSSSNDNSPNNNSY